MGLIAFFHMSISQQAADGRHPYSELCPPAAAEIAAVAITLMGLAARVWMASGTFLNPDEALHFRLANQPTLTLAYRESLTASHPPLLTVVLYYWRALGTSELSLRTPLMLAGTVFCWIFYKWLAKAAGGVAGFIGLLFVAFLPPIVRLSAEIRQYALLLVFLASALYFLDDALEKNSAGNMVLFSLSLYLAMLSHYSAFWFAAALGIYALFRIFMERIRGSAVVSWIAGQLGAIALAAILYKTHLSKLGMGDSRPVLQGWMSDVFLQRSYFDRAHQNAFAFLVGHSFGVFQYFFGQLAAGDVMGLLFIAGIVLLLRRINLPERRRARSLALLIVLPFAIACAASLAHVYPYGGTRHIAFLIIPAMAGISVAIARWSSEKWQRGILTAALVVLACLIFGKERRPRMDRADQNRSHMTDALEFITKNVNASDVIFSDYQSDLVLGHYLCGQQTIFLEAAPAGFEQFSCRGLRVVSRNYKRWWFQAASFGEDWRRLAEDYDLKAGTEVWVFQAEWDANLADELQRDLAEFRNLQVERFGNNIKMFKLTVGQTVPDSSPATGANIP
jgi:hypothetical protein